MRSRIKIFISAILFLMLALPRFTNAIAPSTDSAFTYYEKKEYAKSVAAYEKILSDGSDSWALHYNLANAYYKANELGEAIYHYELAKKMNPSDEDLVNNLMIANTKLVDKMEVKDNFFQSEIKSKVLHVMSLDAFAWLSIISMLSTLGLFFLFINSEKPRAKKTFFWTGFIFAIAFIVTMFLGFGALKEKNNKTNAVILSPSIDVFADPSGQNKKNFQLHEGTRLRVLHTNDSWVNIQMLNGNEGWVKANEIGVY